MTRTRWLSNKTFKTWLISVGPVYYEMKRQSYYILDVYYKMHRSYEMWLNSVL